MFVNKIPFLVTRSWNIKFATLKNIKSRSAKVLSCTIKQVINIYRQNGFQVTLALMDGKFEPLCTDLAKSSCLLNTGAANKHIPDIERFIRVIKERTRAIKNTLPSQRIPRQIWVKMVKFSLSWLNAFPQKGGVSATISPRVLATGTQPDYNTMCRCPFGGYAQVHEELLSSNDMHPCSVGTICLGLSGNLQGGYKFFSLDTGKRITRHNFTKLPMLHEVMEIVEAFAAPQEWANPPLDDNSAPDAGAAGVPPPTRCVRFIPNTRAAGTVTGVTDPLPACAC